MAIAGFDLETSKDSSSALRCGTLTRGPLVEYGHRCSYQPVPQAWALRLIGVLQLPECKDCSSKYPFDIPEAVLRASWEVILTTWASAAWDSQAVKGKPENWKLGSAVLLNSGRKSPQSCGG